MNAAGTKKYRRYAGTETGTDTDTDTAGTESQLWNFPLIPVDTIT